MPTTDTPDRAPWRSYPLRANHVWKQKPNDPVVLGTKPQPVDNEELANMVLMFHLMPADRKREFFTLTGGEDQKKAFLVTYGHLAQWGPRQ